MFHIYIYLVNFAHNTDFILCKFMENSIGLKRVHTGLDK